MAIPMNHVFWFVVLALCLMHLDKSLGGSVVRPHIWALHFWTCHLLGSIHSGWSKLSFKAWWYLVKSATSLFPTIFTCWLWAVGLSEGGILQLMLQSKLLLTTPPLQPSTFSMNCNDVVKPSTILVPAFMSDLRSTWICTFFRQWTHSKHTLPSPKTTLLPCWKNIHGRWRHECFHRSWPAKTTGLVCHTDDLLILQPTGHWYNQLVFALFLGIWWSFCRIRALWPFKYPSIIQYTRWASRKDTFFYMFEVILDGWVGTWKKCLYPGYGICSYSWSGAFCSTGYILWNAASIFS